MTVTAPSTYRISITTEDYSFSYGSYSESEATSEVARQAKARPGQRVRAEKQ